jgi:WD40 repeat protein
MAYDLISPVEITSFTFHPEHEKIVMGGCLNGQVITWDLTSHEHKVGVGRGQKEEAAGGADDNSMQQTGNVMKSLTMSMIEKSHKAYVADLAFVPGTVKVDKKNDNKGLSEHFVTVSEDGYVCIWDSRHVRIEELRAMEASGKNKPWVPFLYLQLFSPNGDPNLGLSRILFQKNQTTTTFWAGSFEGEFLQVDWAVRPVIKEGGAEDAKEARAENVITYYDSERSWRPILAVERSPFYDDLVLTVHDFHFCIWRTSLSYPENLAPIFKSANSFGSHNTCGAFSPTRPGVIFITRTDAIDVWDFYDQSHKPSITLPLATSSITYLKFQHLLD